MLVPTEVSGRCHQHPCGQASGGPSLGRRNPREGEIPGLDRHRCTVGWVGWHNRSHRGGGLRHGTPAPLRQRPGLHPSLAAGLPEHPPHPLCPIVKLVSVPFFFLLVMITKLLFKYLPFPHI